MAVDAELALVVQVYSLCPWVREWACPNAVARIRTEASYSHTLLILPAILSKSADRAPNISTLFASSPHPVDQYR